MAEGCTPPPRVLLSAQAGHPSPRQPRTMTTILTAATTDWAPAIERTVRQIAAVLVAVYAAGYWCGEQLHRLNDDVTALLTLMVPRPKLLAPAVHPLFEIAADLERLTCKELRAITNAPRKAVKAQLVALAARLA